MKNSMFVWSLLASLLPLACGASDQGSGAQTPKTSQTLSAVGDCAFAACGSLPSNLSSTPRVTCSSPSGTECAWSASSSDTTSYRQCAASECPSPPVIDCPSGTLRSTQQCGSTNGAACAWVTVCTPPRSTTPCPDADGCGPMQDIAVICSDNTTGTFVCVTDGAKCSWQNSCD